jgi:serine/threonine protein kinase
VSDPLASQRTPQLFGRYRIVRRISAGGMAEVFLAIDTETGNPVALKRILPHIADEDVFARMFADEAKIVSEFTHPDIPRCLDYGHVDGTWYITFEYIDGEDLRAIYDAANERTEKLPLHFVLHVIARVARSLAYAHEKLDGEGRPFDVVHRDVSPQNVIVGFDGSVKLIDFGVAKAAGKISHTEAGAIKGKFAYLSPEQARGLEVDLRADIFSLGICLWEMLTGERLFAADNEVLVLEKLRTSLVPLPSTRRSGLPSALDSIVMRTLAKDRDDRYQTSSALADDLEGFSRRSNLHCSAHEITQYMRSLFELEVAGDKTSARATETEMETRVMSDNKGSDLDIFESLGKKGLSSTSVLPPDAALSSPAQLPSTQAPAPPPTATSSRSVPPPPPPFSTSAPGGGTMKQTLMGIPMPPPPSMRPSTSPPPPPGRSSLPAVAPPPPRTSGSTVSSVPPPPPAAQSVAPRAPAPATTRPAPSEPNAVAMDWDDEDEATQIFDKPEDSSRAEAVPMPPAGTTSPSDFSPKRTLVMGGAVPLPPIPAPLPAPTPLPARPSHQPPMAVPLPPHTLHGMGPSHSAPPPQVSTMPLSLPPQFAPPHSSGHPLAPMETTAVVRPEGRASGKGVLVAIATASLVIAGGVGAFFMYPKKGKVDIDVTDTIGNKVDEVEIYIDGTKRCDTRPCRVELEAGPRHIKVATRGGPTRFTDEKVIEVRAGESQSVALVVAQAVAQTGRASVAATASLVRVSSTQPGITLFIDGKELGPLPQDAPREVKDVAAGPHTLKFVAGERYADLEKPITVEAGKSLDVSGILLKVKKGAAKVSLNTPGARVFLVSGKTRKELANLPRSVDLDTSEPWALEASKPNMVDFRQAITFDDGHAEKAFAVTLYAKGAEPKDPTPAPTATPTAPTATTESTGPGSILMNSIPPSTCFLDGAALGPTPQVREVKPGTHTVKYVNSELGVSQVVTVKVISGKRAYATVKLKAKTE